MPGQTGLGLARKTGSGLGSGNQGEGSGNDSGNGQNESQTVTVQAPVISARVDIDSGIVVTITGPKGAEIRYTKNGTEPNAESLLYSRALEVSSNTTIKAIAILNGVSSEVTTYVTTGQEC